MKISMHNYYRMNKFLKPEIQKGIEYGLSLDSDYALWRYQVELEKKTGAMLAMENTINVDSGIRDEYFKKFSGKFYSLGVSSGTSALQFSLLSLGIGEGDEVLTVPNTYIGTILAISNTGAKPVFVDVNKDDMLMNPNNLEEKITPKTKAIIPVHLYGQMSDIGKINKVAKKYNLHVIEDAAHAPLADFNGKPPGFYTSAACYSFYPNKSLGAASNGGMIITRSRNVFKNSRIFRDPSSNNPLLLKSHRTPAFLDWIQMVFINAKLGYLHEWLKIRKKNAEFYDKALNNLPLQLPVRNNSHVFCDYVIKTSYRDKLKKYLENKGIHTIIHYSQPIHLTRTYKHLGYKKRDFPVSEKLSKEVLSLPVNPFLTSDELKYVVETIRRYFKEN